jgi:cytochrome P450
VTVAGFDGLADLFSPAQRVDPYPGYARLREEAPIWHPLPGLLVVSRHRDGAAVLRDARFGHAEVDGNGPVPARRRWRAAGSSADPGASGGDDGRDGHGNAGGRAGGDAVPSFLVLNPPDHTRLRRLVARSFTPRRVEDLLPRIEAITEELVGAIEPGDTVDVVDAVAQPLPVQVISELLEIPPADRPLLLEWSHALARSIEPALLVPDSERAEQARARQAFGGYVRQLAAERRRDPRSDLISDLVRTGDREEVLTEAELVATCILLLVAGHETTTSLIGNGLLALLRHPEQLERLRSEPDLGPAAVEELVRYDSPVQLTMRVAREDARIDGTDVPRGCFVIVLAGAANRDPEAHPAPDHLDVGRTPVAHLAFGQGIHFCLGAPLARLEAQVALRALVRRRPELMDEPEWKDTVVLRGVRRLSVRFS